MKKKNLVDLPKEDTVRFDGWSNLVTSIGTSNDKRMYAQTNWVNRSPEWMEQLYASDELASRIVNVVPEEGMRKWVEWTGYEKDVIDKVERRCADLDLKGAIERTWKWARAYGGATCYIVTDTNDPASPLRSGENVIGLRDLSRYDLRILTTDVETDFGSPNWGHPNIYYLTVQMGSSFKGYPIHWTRMVRFDGYMVPRRTFIRNNYWHDSVLNRLYNAIRNYQIANDSAASIMQDFNVGIYKMKNLANMMQAGKENIIKNRIEMINFSKSVARAMVLDTDDEDFVDISRNVSGLAELLDKQANRLVAATDIPHTKLLGESPDGSNATGNSTTAQWFDHIQSEQENYLRPRLKRLIDAVFYDMPELGFKFKPLYQLTELEQADMRLKVAQADQIYIQSGVLDPSEVAESRFGGEAYTYETELDDEGREMGLISPHSSDMNSVAQPEDDGLSDIGGAQPPEGNSINKEPNEPEFPLEEPKNFKSLNEARVGGESAEKKNSGTQFDLRNELIDAPEKVKQLISQTMSEPMRDPKTDPKLKPGGRPNKARVIMPTKGNGIIAPSGEQFKTDIDESMMMPRQLDEIKKDGK